MLGTVVIVVVVIVALIVALVAFAAATKPDRFRVQRSTTIAAPPERIFPLIDDFHRWAEWSPYEKLDPAMKKTFAGPERGKGAIYEWAGNGKAGAGRMEITESSPASRVVIRLEFTRPFKATNVAELTLEPQGEATQVTWATFGPSPLMSKIFQVFVNMDTLLGKDFAAGLAAMKAIAERK